ncbi:hypothetical protein BD413DRAFT_601752 [Trametes elegans]|nr:hypothetical protein BD413DRAFT_601752 [Trametes elegans]
MSSNKRITLYAAIDSPFPHRVRLALEEANAAYDIIWIDLIEKQEWYEKKVCPEGGRVPLLVYGGPELHADEEVPPEAAKISESLVILEFLADVFPDARLLPKDPVLRARARSFCQLVDTTLLMPFLSFVFLRNPAENLFALLEVFQAKLPPIGFAVGEWSIADAAFVPILIRLLMSLKTGLGMFKPGEAEAALATFYSPRFARLQRYLADNMARQSMAKTYDESEVAEVMAKRVERFRKTGIINKDLRVPIPVEE